uniref:Dipeptidyl peptidase 9 n=1 Tax=Panagrolaimus superbus TaxID=310955 RepID=A0A914Y7P4_9BILA
MAPNSVLSYDVLLNDMSWNDCLRHSRYFRLAVKKSFGDTMNNMQIVKLRDGGGPVLFGVGGCEPQTVISAQIPETLEPSVAIHAPIPEVSLKPLFSMNHQQEENNVQPSAEVQLFYERMRSNVVSGITGFTWHIETGALLLSSYNKVQILRKGEIQPVAEWFSGAIMNATLCPCDAEFVAFCANGQLFIDCKNSQFYSTKVTPNHTSGIASFIAQEELERFEGFWWNPKTTEILYEEVDETDVAELSFEIPGKRVGDPMRYPLAGTQNPLSSLKLITLDKQTASVNERKLGASLEELFPWYEYLVRAGWADSEHIYVLLMNRKQTQEALILIHKGAFQAHGKSVEEIRTEFVFVIYAETSSVWLNSNNLLHFLPSIGSELHFLYGSEKKDFCHLYYRSCKLTNTCDNLGLNITDLYETPITGGSWSVMKEAPLSVDRSRRHIYFLSNQISSLITSLCVSSYSVVSGSKILTPVDLCYRVERGQFSLNINPDIGFVAWVSSTKQLPECRFYRLMHSGHPAPNSPLPEAIYHCRLSVQPTIISNPTKDSLDEADYLRAALTDCFEAKFIEYQSRESGFIHHAVAFIPTVKSNSVNGLYPCIHHVYAGPSVQLVKENWQFVAQFLKFLTLGYVVVVVDGRGSANRGISFEAPIKNALGTVEIHDQVEGLLECINRCKVIDRTRVAVTGWSYGGYTSLLLLCNYPNIYRASIAGGAVTEWALYDSCYTERYMDLPKDNPIGYKASSITKFAHKFPNEEGRLLIVHGSIDENVHFTHTEQFMNALIAAGKPFEQLIFPSERHGIRQGSAVEYFHAKMLTFFQKALK